MKFSHFFFLLFCYTVASGQGEPPKYANEIDIKTELSQAEAYRVCGQVLQSEGYSVEHSDPVLGSITTGMRREGPAFFRLVVAVGEGEVRVKGSFTNAIGLRQLGTTHEPIQNRSSGAYKAAFLQMDHYARSLAGQLGGQVTYKVPGQKKGDQ